MAVILSGKETAQELQEVLKQSCGQLQQRGIIPTLELIRVGENAGDLAYERAALKRCNSIGIHTVTKAFSSDAAEEEVIEELHAANSDETVDGVLMLRPLPRHMDSEKVENILLPSKDVDGMTAASLAAVFLNRGIRMDLHHVQRRPALRSWIIMDIRSLEKEQ